MPLRLKFDLWVQIVEFVGLISYQNKLAPLKRIQMKGLLLSVEQFLKSESELLCSLYRSCNTI